MYKRYYDGYSGNANFKNGGEIIVPETITEAPNQKSEACVASCNDVEVSNIGCKNNILNLPFELDDLILIGILIFLLFDKNDCKKDDDNDIFMLLIIGFILFSDIF